MKEEWEGEAKDFSRDQKAEKSQLRWQVWDPIMSKCKAVQ